MYYLDKLKTELAGTINAILGQTVVSAADFVTPPDPKLGDLSLACFALAKATGENPTVIAKRLEAEIKIPSVASVSASGPYFNIILSGLSSEAILTQILTDSAAYGNSEKGGGKRVMLEFANYNTHKEIHVGHLRNIAFGDSVTRILKAAGYDSIPVCYINDFGIHTAKTIWYFRKTAPKVPEGSKGFFLGQLYAASVVALAENPEAKAEVGEVMRAIESRQGEIYETWQETRKWSLEQMAAVDVDLGLKFAETFYENDFLSSGLEMVQKLKDKGILIESQGAVIADLDQYKLGVLVVLRSDGTALYPVADLSLTFHKVEKYKLDTSLWVVDVRQGQYLHQLFKLLELAGLKAQLTHLPYDFVTLPSGMMSSRSGNIIRYEELKDAALHKTIEETKKRHEDWSDERVNAVANVLAFGALKYEMIKVGGDKIITFEMDKALRFDGNTAAYLQYTYARIMSMQRKAPAAVSDAVADFAALDSERDRKLALYLGLFPQAVERAAAAYQPSEIAKYLFELGQLFNDYYHAMPILNDATLPPATAHARLQLAAAVANVIKRGLDLLGIATVEEM